MTPRPTGDGRAGELIALALRNEVNRALLERLAAMEMPDAWLTSGCVFQTAWNGLTGRAPDHGVLDYDVFYFDPDLSLQAEEGWISRCAGAFADLGAVVQVRNQARVHLWYPTKFGRPYPALTRATQALERFLAPCCAVALRRQGDEVRLTAPFGLGDIFDMVVRPNPALEGSSQQYDAKAARWRALWPELDIRPWRD